MNLFEKSKSIKNHEITAMDNLNSYIDVIDEKNEKINAFIELNTENALTKAKEIDEKIKNNEKTGKLAGLVLGVKANISIEDLHISAASRTLENYLGSFDATVIEKIKEEDGIIIGLTNMDEFAAGNTTETSFFGPTQNPSAPGRIPGGSSGGSAAAIAAGMCDIALGSDTGGSIRNPASHCGIIGFKPSYGTVSRQGLLDLSMTLDQIGTLCSDYSGIAMLTDVIDGYDPKDSTSLDWGVPTFSDITVDEAKSDVSKMKIGVVKQFKDLADDKINKVTNDAISEFEDLGAEIAELEFNSLKLCVPTFYLINFVEFFSATRKYDGLKYGYKIEDTCGEEVLRRLEMGSYISQKEFSGKFYKKALEARSVIKKDFINCLADVDLIMSPTVPKLPQHIGDEIDPLDAYSYDVLTVVANLAGIPAASVNAGRVDDVPVGLQIQAKPFDDYKVVQAIAAFDKKA